MPQQTLSDVKVAVKVYGPKALLWAAEKPGEDFMNPEFVYKRQVSREQLQALVDHSFAASERAFLSILKQSRHQDKWTRS